MKTILITGVASGIGKETCKYFLENNYKVIGLDIKESFKHDNLVSFIVDITNKEKLLEIKDYLFEKNIKLDAIVNIAGIHKMASLVESDYESLKKLIDINLLGTILVNNIFHSLLVKKGRIVRASEKRSWMA